MDGVILIDKPRGVTSFDVVKKVRWTSSTRKVGHAGTLDPLASGLLIVAIGQGTKLIPYLMESNKRYTGTVALGSQTDTDDAEGEPIETAQIPSLDEETVKVALDKFVGKVEQTPPAYSALKENGVALYKKARRGEKVTPKSRIVEIPRIDLLGLESDEFSIEVHCKKGTYIRSLARDIAIELNTKGHLKALRRTETSGFDVTSALPLDSLDEATFEANLLSLKDALPQMPKLAIDEENESRVKMGKALIDINESDIPTFDDGISAKHICLVDPQDRMLAIGLFENETIRPIRVMVY